MASVAMLIRGALANALAFTGSSYLFHRLSADNIDAERKGHNAAIEALQKVQIKWTHKCQQRIDFINNQLRLEQKAETKFTELNDAMREYHEVFGHELSPLPREPVLSDFYTPADEQHYRELGFMAFIASLGGGSPPPEIAPPPPGNNASTSTPMAIPIAMSIEAIVIPCFLNRVLIFSPN